MLSQIFIKFSSYNILTSSLICLAIKNYQKTLIFWSYIAIYDSQLGWLQLHIIMLAKYFFFFLLKIRSEKDFHSDKGLFRILIIGVLWKSLAPSLRHKPLKTTPEKWFLTHCNDQYIAEVLTLQMLHGVDISGFSLLQKLWIHSN